MNKKNLVFASDVIALKLKILAKEKEDVRLKLVVTAKEKESVRKKLVVTAKQLAVTAKEKEDVRLKLVVTAKELKRLHETLENKVIERTKDLEGARAKDEAILASIGDGLIVTDEKGKIVFGNSVFEKLLGWQMNEVKGKLLSEVVPMLDGYGNKIPESRRLVTEALVKGETTKTTSGTTEYARKDGSKFPVMISVSPVVITGVTVGAVEVFRDITKEKEVDKAKTEFVSLASHQLRTPLSTVKWYVEMLLAGDVGKVIPEQKKYLDEVYRGNQRMIELVNALLNVSRIELGTFVVEPEPTDITKLAQGEISEQKLQIDAKRIKFSSSFENDIPMILADPKLLHMAVQNLLSNAVKYTPEGGKIKLSLTLDNANKAVLLKVSDTGYGIPNNQQDKIFTKLFRADNVREKDTEGTGLGLYIVKSIIEHSGGKIWFSSEENKGTTFYVTVPIEGINKKESVKVLSQ